MPRRQLAMQLLTLLSELLETLASCVALSFPHSHCFFVEVITWTVICCTFCSRLSTEDSGDSRGTVFLCWLVFNKPCLSCLLHVDRRFELVENQTGRWSLSILSVLRQLAAGTRSPHSQATRNAKRPWLRPLRIALVLGAGDATRSCSDLPGGKGLS